MWLTLVFGVTVVFFLSMSLAALINQRWARRLPPLAALPAGAHVDPAQASRVRCSTIVAVRNEDARVEGTVRHLLAQRDVAIEVIAVDDRSTDRTTEILNRLAMEDTRLRVLRVEALPDGWLGKCHACHVGARAATGDWLLFTDADCWLQPDVLARALRVAEIESADHVTLTPGVEVETLAARAWHLALLTRFTGWMSRVNRDRPKAYFGIGAFNLVRASAYRDCGGYEALRLTIVDDVKLGLLLQRAGKRTRAFLGAGDMECHWGTTVPRMMKIMEKNYFAAIDYRVAPVVALTIIGTLVVGGTLIGPWTGTAAGIAAGLAPWSLVVPAAILAHRVHWPLVSALMTPLLFPVLIYSVINSAAVTLRQGGVRWRDTFYALDALRKGNVR